MTCASVVVDEASTHRHDVVEGVLPAGERGGEAAGELDHLERHAQLAEQARPGTFAALWLFEPIVFPDGIDEPADNPLEAGALRRRDSFPSREEAFANFASKAPLDELCSEALAAYVTHGFVDTPDGIALACRPEDEAAGYRMGVRHSAWAHLGEVRCPVVVTRGRSLGADPAAIAPLIAEGLPGGHLEDHPELGHFGPLAEPGTMAGSIRRLVEGLGA